MRIAIERGSIDLERATVEDERGKAVARLTTREVELLRYVCQRAGQDLARDTLLVENWNYSPKVQSRALDTTVARLRRKIERDPSNPRHIVTVHGVGYRWVSLLPERSSVLRPLLHLSDRAVDLDYARVSLTETGASLDLSSEEGALLRRLMKASGEWVAAEELAPRPASRKRLKHLVHRLRAKLEPDPSCPPTDRPSSERRARASGSMTTSYHRGETPESA